MIEIVINPILPGVEGKNIISKNGAQYYEDTILIKMKEIINQI